MIDILLYESGNGGEMLLKNNDISLVNSLFQQIYLSLFGGNLEANTQGNEIEGQIREDWWANSLLFNESEKRQFNSNTERVLNTTALNSSGRNKIINAVETDLRFLKEIADIKVNVKILSEKKCEIIISLNQPQNLEDKILRIIWDNAKLETVEDIQI